MLKKLKINSNNNQQKREELDSDRSQALISLNQSFEIQTDDKTTYDEQFNKLVLWVEHLIDRDFNRLLSILYRIDVSEQKIKTALIENKGQNPGVIIATLMLEREIQKRKFREMFSKKK